MFVVRNKRTTSYQKIGHCVYKCKI